MIISNMKQKLKYKVQTATFLIEHFRDEVKGVAAIEFAFLAPLMLLMYIGTIEISAAMSANRKLSRVSSTIGDLMTQSDCYEQNTINDIVKIADHIMYPYNSDNVEVQISGVQITGNNAEVVWSEGDNALAVNSPYTVPDKIKIDGNFLVAAKVNMSYAPAIGWFSLSGLTNLSKETTAIEMEEELFLRPRIGNSVQVGGC